MIFQILKRRAQEPSPAGAAYSAIVAAARRRSFYSELAVPDTLPGRFELIVLHVALVLRRLRREGDASKAVGQELFDEMFRSMEAALRELGVGDLTVPKRMKAMVRSFYDGAAIYDAALDGRDAAALAGALRRIVYRDQPADDAAPAKLAAYAVGVDDSLAGQGVDQIVESGPVFRAPETS